MEQVNFEHLENLITGKVDSVEIITLDKHISRESLIEQINSFMMSLNTQGWCEGKFVNCASSDYLIYDLQLFSLNKSAACIRFFEFGDRIKLVKI